MSGQVEVKDLVVLLQAMINDLSLHKYNKHQKEIARVMNSDLVQKAFEDEVYDQPLSPVPNAQADH